MLSTHCAVLPVATTSAEEREEDEGKRISGEEVEQDTRAFSLVSRLGQLLRMASTIGEINLLWREKGEDIMMSKIRLLPSSVLAAALGIGATVVITRAETPSASIAFETAEGSSSIEAKWTGCTIFFQGKAHGCSVSGLQSPTPGMNRVSGVIYDLKDLPALAGTYKAVGTDASMGPGHLRVKNDKGTTMTLWPFSNMQGNMQEIQVPDGGMKIELKK